MDVSLTCVGIKADRGVESLSMLQHIERQRHFNAVTFVLNSLQCLLQSKPETDLLQSSARRWVTIQLRYLTTTTHINYRVRQKIVNP